MPVVERGDVGEHVLAVVAGVLVAAPGVHGVGPAAGPGRLHGLAEREIRVAAVRAELDEGGGLQHLDQPEHEGHMPDPGIRRDEADRLPEQLVAEVEGLGQLVHEAGAFVRGWLAATGARGWDPRPAPLAPLGEHTPR